MNSINYNLISIINNFIFVGIIFLIILFLRKKCPRFFKKEQRFIVILLIVLFIIYKFNPVDALIFRFDSLNEASKFFSTNKEVITKYEFDDYAYIIYGKNGFHNVKYYKKVGSKWKIGNYKLGNLNHRTIKKNRMVFYIYKTPNSDNIIVSNFYIVNNDDQISKIKSATDSYNNKFDTQFYRCNQKTCYVLINTNVKETLKEDYTINIGKTKFNLF